MQERITVRQGSSSSTRFFDRIDSLTNLFNSLHISRMQGILILLLYGITAISSQECTEACMESTNHYCTDEYGEYECYPCANICILPYSEECISHCNEFVDIVPSTLKPSTKAATVQRSTVMLGNYNTKSTNAPSSSSMPNSTLTPTMVPFSTSNLIICIFVGIFACFVALFMYMYCILKCNGNEEEVSYLSHRNKDRCSTRIQVDNELSSAEVAIFNDGPSTRRSSVDCASQTVKDLEGGSAQPVEYPEYDSLRGVHDSERAEKDYHIADETRPTGNFSTSVQLREPGSSTQVYGEDNGVFAISSDQGVIYRTGLTASRDALFPNA